MVRGLVMEQKKIDLVPDESGFGWKIYKGSVHVSDPPRKSPNPFRQIGTLFLSDVCFQLNTGEELSQEEREMLFEAIKGKKVFKDICIDVD